MSALQTLLDTFRNTALTEREKGTYFESLVKVYLLNEPSYKDLFNGKVFLWEEWRKYWIAQGNSDPQSDAGIDLVAVEDVAENPRIFAIQAKFYAEDSKIRKGDGIDSFLSAMGKNPYTNGLLFITTSKASTHVIEGMKGRDKLVNIISLFDLESSQIDWSQYQPTLAPVLKAKKSLRPHQSEALTNVLEGFKTVDRGKLIMACGTGKTFTSLKIAEAVAGKGKRVLFLVPSLSLLSQTLTEWTQESATPLHSFAVCSDSDVGKKRGKEEDAVQMLMHELRYPATTEPARLAAEMTKRHDADHMSVVFSTYHSIDVISKAQQQFNLADFDLIVCDEAHRTTGATFDGDDESAFVKVHDANFIRASKRLYMTATPRIYSDIAEAKAEKADAKLYGMNNEQWYGKELYVLSFSEAVKQGLLVDYKVLVLAMDASHISARLQEILKDENNQIKVEDAAKIVGCWKALSKQDTREDLTDDANPMRRAVAFCQVIEYQTGAKTHKISSKKIANMFKAVVEEYKASNPDDTNTAATLNCEASHVDGGMNAGEKETQLNWLKAEIPDNTCRILSNVRCLSEGVDVPALDAVLFLTPRNSQVDVVQSVGRVMRLAEGKKRGYVVLPVVIPAGMAPEEALNDNKTYKVVWQVLQALRSHDDRFDAMVNKLDLIGKDISKMEVIAVSDKIAKKADKAQTKPQEKGKGTFGIGETAKKYDLEGQIKEQETIKFEIGEIERAIYAKVVQKCGNRSHWEDWARNIAEIAQTHIARIATILANPENTKEQAVFAEFAKELRDDLNDSISDAEIIEMLAQHLITKPVFDALFSNFSFAQHNPISQAMQGVLEALQEHNLSKEADTLEKFYASVKMRAEGIDSPEGKQKIIIGLYDNFFSKAFPRMKERLGIVYTPVEVVDFIIHSINHILQTEFGQTLGSKGVHIIDPFTGTGTFITRLLQSGLIKPEELPHKYQHEIHANEIVLLAYYIAAINIEAVYHSIARGDYLPFEGICLTDTFQLYEKEDLVDQILVKNSARRKRQKKLDIRVIMGNPPYSAGQKSENDNNKNLSYAGLDERIGDTYIAMSRSSMGKSKAYDSYVRAFRWASDRIGNAGVLGFITGSGFIDKPAFSGMRRCLREEFSHLYLFNLRGDIRKNILSKGAAGEGGNIFGSDSMTGIVISILVKNPTSKSNGDIHYFDIGDNLSEAEKLNAIKDLSSIEEIGLSNSWVIINPDEHDDWIAQRNLSLSDHILIGDKSNDKKLSIFETYSIGILSNRDKWVYNFSKKSLFSGVQKMISFFNSESKRLKGVQKDDIGSRVNLDESKIKWTTDLFSDLSKGNIFSANSEEMVYSQYRPFAKSWVYSSAKWNWSRHLMPLFFPTERHENKAICISGVGARSGFSVMLVNTLPDKQTLDNSQCFPLYLYESAKDSDKIDFERTGDMFAAKVSTPADCKGGYTRKDAITDSGLKHFQDAYPGEKISKEGIFYYVYGLLHSPDYRERYADNLSKELPRIPCVKTSQDFWHFSQAGRDLAALHLNYETVEPYPVTLEITGKTPLADEDYRVEKMKYPKKGKDKDLTTLIYNHRITLKGIPLEAYDYIVNGKPALDWVVERQCVKTDKDSGIVNDANDWAIETMGNPKYPLELFMRVITVSLETMKIVNGLPKLDI